LKALIAAVAAMSLVGCASVMNDVTYGMRIDTKTASGENIDGADCTVTNDYGSTSMKSGTKQAVRRSSKDLDIVCTHEGQLPAKGTATSRANAGLAGNIILGGVIGAVVDHNRGTAYTYPTWIEMVFGQTLLFDRRQEKEGSPVKGVLPGTAPVAASTTATTVSSSQACQHQLPGAVCNK